MLARRAWRRLFSTEPIYQSAPLHPLRDNEHLRPANLPAPKKQGSWTWITGINSALFRPSGWSVYESTIVEPWKNITGNPLRVYYVTKDSPTKGYFNVGMTVSAFCVDRQHGEMTHLAKAGRAHLLVDSVLAPMRFSDGTTSPDEAPKILPTIKITNEKTASPDKFDRLPVQSSRFSYTQFEYVPENIAAPPTTMRFELEWATHIPSNWVFELVFQAPEKEFEAVWNEYGKFMMSTDKGHFLMWDGPK